MHSLLFQAQCFRLLSILPIVSLTGLNVNFQFVFPFFIGCKNGIDIVLELHGIALQMP